MSKKCLSGLQGSSNIKKIILAAEKKTCSFDDRVKDHFPVTVIIKKNGCPSPGTDLIDLAKKKQTKYNRTEVL